jgi:hypothetical protein
MNSQTKFMDKTKPLVDVHRFDAHDIPFDGPNGILAKTERLLNKSSTLSDESKRRLLDNLIQIILQNA